MEFNQILDWAFERHLNPLSWYIRPIFLVLFAYFAYRRSWKGIVITVILMTSSMVWFPAPETISPDMQLVLEYEKQLLSSPMTAILALGLVVAFMTAVGLAFWKHSLKMGLVILNATLIGKVVLSVFFTGESGWAPLGNTLFGLLLVNGIGLYILHRMRARSRPQELAT